MIQVKGQEGWVRIHDMVVLCATLLTHAAAAAAPLLSPSGGHIVP
jgi:hypothetical protein